MLIELYGYLHKLVITYNIVDMICKCGVETKRIFHQRVYIKNTGLVTLTPYNCVTQATGNKLPLMN